MPVLCATNIRNFQNPSSIDSKSIPNRFRLVGGKPEEAPSRERITLEAIPSDSSGWETFGWKEDKLRINNKLI